MSGAGARVCMVTASLSYFTSNVWMDFREQTEAKRRTKMFRYTRNNLFLAAPTAIALFLVAPRSAHAQCTTDPVSGPSIQEAVNSGCAQILVKPGTYHENVVIPAGQTVSIRSLNGTGRAIVEGRFTGNVFNVNSGANVTLTGLIIQNGAATGGGGIIGLRDTITLNDCIVTGNTAYLYAGGGIEIAEGTLALNRTIVTGNTAAIAGGGINSDDSTVTMDHCSLTGNISYFGGGFSGYLGRTVTISDSAVTGNSAFAAGGGIHHHQRALTPPNRALDHNSGDAGD